MVDTNRELTALASGATGFLKFVLTIGCVKTGALTQAVGYTNVEAFKVTDSTVSGTDATEGKQGWADIEPGANLGTFIGVDTARLE